MEAAITFALDNKSKSVTLVHKGAALRRHVRAAAPPCARRDAWLSR